MKDPSLITSLQNNRIKDLVRLRDRSGRKSQALMLIEEARVIRRALAAAHPLTSVFASPDTLDRESSELFREIQAANTPEIVLLAPHVMEKVSYRHDAKGLLITAPRLDYRLEDLELSAPPLLLILESVEKPGNLGAILRSANGAGVDAVLVCGRTVDLCNPNVLRASTGAVFTTPTIALETPDLMAYLKAQNIPILATTPDTSADYTFPGLDRAVAIAIGAEDTGLSQPWLEAAARKVRIPMHGNADSLNASVSAALLVYEARRQRSPDHD